jgi:hypothetical protein
MKKLFLMLVLIAVVFVAYDRQRLFVRDPLGSVTRDGVQEKGAQVFINYSNDVLIENDNPPMHVTLVQHGQPIGTPAKLKCVHYVVCLTDADVAKLVDADPGGRIDSMGGKLVEYRNGSGQATAAKLR